ncbi:TrkH family potassium uptake protein [Jeotgalibaca sp. MA1X17-3]|uniref:TrkH family potassium uptake protein n=1 Tax=Jeotgalibaca sp. MA1X17-3 TaxID=2908211 RepID=UPI001F362DD3|nr:TrkH family potassium uptake protein [Jeotgalibaca sp. MA1X17-3]UJF16334.1 TrkH family potassium uptake protein [Jeotgalibaca sp. MA1X17-3]
MRKTSKVERTQTLFLKLNPSARIASGFFLLIIIGTFLLKLPFATTQPISWFDTLFTATSAVTVTGLIVVNTGTAFTIFGQSVIMVLMQLGGLGLMTFAVSIFLLLKRKVGMQQRMLIQESFNQNTTGGLVQLVRGLIVFALGIEGIGFILLSLRWIPEFGWKRGAFVSLFHTIAAFNNAGFSIWSDNLSAYQSDPIVTLTITSLFLLGGIGFTVLLDVWHHRKFKVLSLHSKIMIVGTFVVNTIALLLIFSMEYSNPETIGNLSVGGKLLASYFQALTPRTAGFNSVNISGLYPATLLLTTLLMFIGAGSASTGSGIKLSTFIVLLLTPLTVLSGKKETSIFGRTIKDTAILRALTITIISMSLVFVGTFILMLTEQASFMEILFEVVSAFGTVGLTMGLTPYLSTTGKIVIMMIMFTGRIGSLTIASILARKKETFIRYPKEDVFIG